MMRGARLALHGPAWRECASEEALIPVRPFTCYTDGPPRCERECEHCCMICLTNASRRRRTALNGAAHINARHGHKSPHPSIWHYCVAWAMTDVALVDDRSALRLHEPHSKVQYCFHGGTVTVNVCIHSEHGDSSQPRQWPDAGWSRSAPRLCTTFHCNIRERGPTEAPPSAVNASVNIVASRRRPRHTSTQVTDTKSPHPSIWHYRASHGRCRSSMADGATCTLPVGVVLLTYLLTYGWRGGGCRERRKRQAPPHPSLLTPSERDPSLPKLKQRLHKQGPSLHQTHRCTQIRSAGGSPGGSPCGSEASERWSPSTAVVKRDDWRSRTAACTRLRLATRARSSFASTFALELSAVVGGASGGGGGTSSEGAWEGCGGDFMGVGDSNGRPRCK